MQEEHELASLGESKWALSQKQFSTRSAFLLSLLFYLMKILYSTTEYIRAFF